MKGDSVRAGIHVALLASMAPRARAFDKAVRDPRSAQRAALARVVDSVRGTLLLRRLRGLERVRCVTDLATAAPLSTWDDIEDDVMAMARGAQQVRTAQPLVRFERSGGSSGPQKLVPMTKASLDDMQRGLSPWLYHLYASRPPLMKTSAYWSISPIGAKAAPTEGGIPTSAVDDSEYLPGPARALIRRVLVAHPALAHLNDVDDCRYATLRLLLARPDLGLISIWSPTFLSLLLDALDAHAERLVDDVEHGTCRVPSGRQADVIARLPLSKDTARAHALRALLREGRFTPQMLWPRLSLVSLWTHGESARFVDDVTRRLPDTALEEKGLLATEGIVSIPIPNAVAPVLAVTSHVYEFMYDDGRIVPAWELNEGDEVEVVLSTTAGLLRYRLGDRVRVVGFHHGTPCLRFLGRAGVVSDLVGEKISGAFVASVLATNAAGASFAMLAPVRDTPQRYRLYLSGIDVDTAKEVAARVEQALCEGHPYRYARALSQLAAVEAVVVDDGARRFMVWRTALGQRAGDVKISALCTDDGCHRALCGEGQ